LMQSETVPEQGLQYLNRLSDFLFVISRTLNRAADTSEPCWKRSWKDVFGSFPMQLSCFE